MIFSETKLKGIFIIQPEVFEDKRGFFARSWNRDECARRGLRFDLVENNISFNKRKGTLRGMHFQIAPHSQIKLVRCTSGSIYDVVLDLRENSPTRHQWVGLELSAENRLLLYIPEDFAHGFQTLTDDSEVTYQISTPYHPESARGVRWDDPAFGIDWPLGVSVMSERDRSHPFVDSNQKS